MGHFNYVKSNPINFVDPKGLSAYKPSDAEIKKWKGLFDKFKDIYDECKGDVKELGTCTNCCKKIAQSLYGNIIASPWPKDFNICQASPSLDEGHQLVSNPKLLVWGQLQKHRRLAVHHQHGIENLAATQNSLTGISLEVEHRILADYFKLVKVGLGFHQRPFHVGNAADGDQLETVIIINVSFCKKFHTAVEEF